LVCGENSWEAIEQGDADAQIYLDAMYAKGQGVIQDNVYAQIRWNITASTGIEGAVKNRAIVEKRITPAQIAAALKLARECVHQQNG